MGKETFNIYWHSICFLLVFTAFNTSGGIAQRALNGYKEETKDSENPFQDIDGFTSIGLVYLFFATFNWVAPIVIDIIGEKLSMVAGALVYSFYIYCYIKPDANMLYFASAAVGCAAAVIWTAQGAFITKNSNDETMRKNSNIFWAILQSAMIWGNLYIYNKFAGIQSITSEVREPLYWKFTVLSVAGSLGFLLLKGIQPKEEKPEEPEAQEMKPVENPTAEPETNETTAQKCKRIFLEAVNLFQTKNMLIICIIFLYTGFHQSFWSGVYPFMVGKCKDFGEDSDRLAGINGIVLGLGQVLGGLLFSLFPGLVKKYLSREKTVLMGSILHLLAFLMIYGNFDPTMPLSKEAIENSEELTLMAETETGKIWEIPDYSVSVVTVFLLGFGDCCFNTQVIAYLGVIYKDQAAPAFAIFKKALARPRNDA